MCTEVGGLKQNMINVWDEVLNPEGESDLEHS